MALSKSYQLKDITSTLRILTGQLDDKLVKRVSFTNLINKNTLDLAEMLNGASAPDYGVKTIVNDTSSSVSSTVVAGKNYDDATRNIGSAAHGFTNADIGRRIAYWVATSRIAIGEIESIPSANNFIVTKELGADATGTLNYAVFTAHSATSIDLSNLKIDKIISLSDSISGLVSEAKDFEFENLGNIEDYRSSLFYNHFGEVLYLFKGNDVTTYGTLTLGYYRLPVLVSADTDYIDVKDKHIPLLIDKCKLEIYEVAKALAPKELTTSVESKTAGIRAANDSKEAAIAARNK